MRNPLLLGLGLVSAACYMVGVGADLFMLELLAKPIPVICLMLWLRRYVSECPYRTWVFRGLFLSMIGDFFMTAPDKFLIPAMGAFGLAHISYIAAYLSVTKKLEWLRALPFILWCSLVFWVLSPKMGDMLIPVSGYMVVIGTMMWRAMALPPKLGSGQTWLAPAGAIIFALSDTMIAFRLFDDSFPADRYLIIVTYWVGQWLITASARVFSA